MVSIFLYSFSKLLFCSRSSTCVTRMAGGSPTCAGTTPASTRSSASVTGTTTWTVPTPPTGQSTSDIHLKLQYSWSLTYFKFIHSNSLIFQPITNSDGFFLIVAICLVFAQKNYLSTRPKAICNSEADFVKAFKN